MATTLTITSTPHVVTLDGVECRLWNGTTASGRQCHLYIHRVAAKDVEEFADLRTVRVAQAGLEITYVL